MVLRFDECRLSCSRCSCRFFSIERRTRILSLRVDVAYLVDLRIKYISLRSFVTGSDQQVPAISLFHNAPVLK